MLLMMLSSTLAYLVGQDFESGIREPLDIDFSSTQARRKLDIGVVELQVRLQCTGLIR